MHSKCCMCTLIILEEEAGSFDVDPGACAGDVVDMRMLVLSFVCLSFSPGLHGALDCERCNSMYVCACMNLR